MSRADERYQDERITDLIERVAFLEGALGREDHDHDHLQLRLAQIRDELRGLAAAVAQLGVESAEQTELLRGLAAEHEPKGFITINAGPVSEIR